MERWYGREILDHQPKSVRLERAADGLPLFLNHSDLNHVGHAHNIRLTDKVGRAGPLQFSRTQGGQDALMDVEDGIKRGVSVGYAVHAMEKESETEGLATYRVTDWEPWEISLTPIPADTTVGVGRGAERQFQTTVRGNTMDKQNDLLDPEPNPTEADNEPAVTRGAPEASDSVISLSTKYANLAREEERARGAEIDAAAEHFGRFKGVAELAAEAKREGWSADEFTERLQPVLAEAQVTSKEIGLSPVETQSWSMMRAMRLAVALLDGRPERELKQIAPFELEASIATREAGLGSQHESAKGRGISVPPEVLNGTRWHAQRQPMDTTVSAALVGTEHLASAFIEALRPVSAVMAAGATTLNGLVQNVDIPKQTGLSSVEFVAEDGTGTDTVVPTGKISLTPTTLWGAIPITRRLLLQSQPDAEMLARNDLVEQFAATIDQVSVNGSGAGPIPLGITGQTGVNTVVIATIGSLSWSNVVDFLVEVANDNALRGNQAFLMHPTVWGPLIKNPMESGDARRMIGGGDPGSGVQIGTVDVLGTPVMNWSTSPPPGAPEGMVFGCWGQLILGFWSTLDLVADRATKVASGGLVVRGFQDLDINVRHAQSFAIRTLV